MARQHKDARYRQTARLFQELGSVEAVCAATGLSKSVIYTDIAWCRRAGILPRRTADAERWASETARISDLTVGSRSDLLCSLGADLVKRIATECPKGVPLMVYMAGIIKDAYDDESL